MAYERRRYYLAQELVFLILTQQTEVTSPRSSLSGPVLGTDSKEVNENQ